MSSSQNKILYIREENNKYERRVPIIPEDVPILIENGFIVFVKTSSHRIYKDFEYVNKGAIITTKEWYDPLFCTAYIIGLKYIDKLENLNKHKHIYFSHSYKNQIDSEYILTSFYKSSSLLYDFEYFIDNENKRVISFGFYAGIVGCYLGLLQYLQKTVCKQNISNICGQRNLTQQDIMDYLSSHYNNFVNLNIAIVGFRGNSGGGVISLLDKLGINYSTLGRTFDKETLKNYDIVYNCINLDLDSKDVWFSETTVFDSPIIIVDISCDTTKCNNPIAIDYDETTWDNPVYSYNNFVDIIAISNLPSLLPKESSCFFSKQCANLLLNIDSDIWKNNEKIFREKCAEYIDA